MEHSVLGRNGFVLHVRAYAPFDVFGGVFHGDGARRRATTAACATARVHAWVPFNPVDGTVGTPQARSDASHTTIAPKVSRTAQPRAICRSVRIPSGLFLQVDAWGANPLLPPAPDIDVRAMIEVTLTSGRLGVSASLSGDLFPNFELFIADEKDARRMILVYNTDGGRTTGPLIRLWGARQANMGGICASFSVDKSGYFQ